MSATKKLSRGARAYLRSRIDGLVVAQMRSARRLTHDEREALQALLRHEHPRARDRVRPGVRGPA